MIVFENKGLLDLRCVRTMGVNVKEKDDAIGHFGTGLKYAIATLLRNSCKVTLIIDNEHYKFDTKTDKIRGKEFSFVTMNGEEIGFTTELGKNWEPWMAYRELYSNMLDEDEGAVTSGRSWPKTRPGFTYICVTGDAMSKVHGRRHKYFLAESNRKPAYEFNGVDFYDSFGNENGAIFYRGILVSAHENGAIYDYNLTEDTSLTEDRTLRYPWEGKWAIVRTLLRIDDRTLGKSEGKDLIKRVLTASMGVYESALDFMGVPCQPTEFFLDVVQELRDEVDDAYINRTALALLFKNRKNKDLPTVSIDLNPVQQKQLDKAVEFCKNVLEFNDLDNYPIIVCENLGKHDLGRADMDDGRIFISKKCFENGTKRIAVALLEEYTHCKHKVHDETVEQKWVYLEQIISLGERIQGEPL